MIVLATVLPIFLLILVGFGLARARGLDATAVSILNLFVVWLALPALLFRFVATADAATLDQPGFALAFTIGIVATFAASWFAAPRVGRHTRSLSRRSLDALTASYANTAFMGLPLAQGLLGNAGVAAAVIASLLTVCVLFGFSILLIEVDRNRGGGAGRTVRRVAGSLLRNPIVVAPVAGALWAATGVPLPVILDTPLAMLGGAATPVALVTIGIFLAQRRPGGQSADLRPELGLAVVLKLLVQPLATLAALAVLPVTRPYAHAALLLAALPTGTGPFMVAELYRQEVALASRAILLSTLLSAASVSALAWWLLG